MYTNVVDGHTSLGDGFTYPDGGYTDPGDMTKTLMIDTMTLFDGHSDPDVTYAYLDDRHTNAMMCTCILNMVMHLLTLVI